MENTKLQRFIVPSDSRNNTGVQVFPEEMANIFDPQGTFLELVSDTNRNFVFRVSGRPDVNNISAAGMVNRLLARDAFRNNGQGIIGTARDFQRFFDVLFETDKANRLFPVNSPISVGPGAPGVILPSRGKLPEGVIRNINDLIDAPVDPDFNAEEALILFLSAYRIFSIVMESPKSNS